MQNPDCFVLIRGMLREARHWDGFTACLQKRFPYATILTPDIPGNGRLYAQTSPDSISAMTDALREQIDRRQPFNLIGISMGGMIAMDWMHRYPEEICSSVLINTSARPISPFHHRLRWQIFPSVIKMLLRPGANWEREILALTSNLHRRDMALLQRWLRWRKQCPVSPASARNQFKAAVRFRLPNCSGHPLLIVTSKADRMVDYRCSLQLHHAIESDYLEHDTAGHDLTLDAPGWVADVIRDWFERRKPQNR